MVLVDANVLLDILTDDPQWADWSAAKLEQALPRGLAINAIIYGELAVGFHQEAELENALALMDLKRLAVPYAAAFRAGHAFVEYRKRGGERRSPLPDFIIGAHALAEGMTLLTRDATRYRTYFPKLKLIAPD